MASYDPLTGLPRRRPGQPGFGQVEQELSLIGGPPARTTSGGFAPGRSYSSILKIPGTQPDFLGILNSDPLLSQFRSGLGAESVADRAQRDALIQRALVGFGEVPDFSAAAAALGLPGDELSGIANPETRALAQKNTEEGLSTVGRLNREFQRVRQNLMDALAARGALRSGATGVALSDLQQDRKVAQVDARQQLLDYIGEFTRGYLEGQRQRARDLAAAQTQAAGRIDPNALAATPEQEARHIGNGIYESPDGRLWNSDGTPYSGPDPRNVSTQPRTPPVATGQFIGQDEVFRAGRRGLV